VDGFWVVDRQGIHEETIETRRVRLKIVSENLKENQVSRKF
jgi:hypothetical protein